MLSLQWSARFVDRAAKRTFDLLGAAIGLCLLALPMCVIAIWIRAQSSGRALFLQERIGRDGRPFHIIKFRTMVADADLRGSRLTIGADPRITPFGAFLRRHKLDELPQLLNILKGDMSFVGPRPELPYYLPFFFAEQRHVLFSVRPGVTDPASLALIDEAGVLGAVADPVAHYENVLLPLKTSLRIEYVKNRTFWGDLVLIWRTASLIFHRATKETGTPTKLT